jgi:uncharacterized protein YoxC
MKRYIRVVHESASAVNGLVSTVNRLVSTVNGLVRVVNGLVSAVNGLVSGLIELVSEWTSVKEWISESVKEWNQLVNGLASASTYSNFRNKEAGQERG